MRKGIVYLGVLVFLLVSLIVSKVKADGYEVTPVGGVLEPTNIVMLLSQAVILGGIIFGSIAIFAFIRSRKTCAIEAETNELESDSEPSQS
jgi:hypothetical protein